MSSKVLHGEGKPRIIVPTSAILTGNTNNSSSTTLELLGSPSIPSTVIGKLCYTENIGLDETKGRITAYNNTTDIITVESWDNGIPDTGNTYTIKDYAIDLPYCESLVETFQFEQHNLLLLVRYGVSCVLI